MVALQQMLDNKKPDLNDYQANTRKLIQDHIDMSEIDRICPILVVNKDFRRHIDELPQDIRMREILLENGLRAILASRLNFMPVYQTLLKQLDTITREKDYETTDVLGLLIELTGEIYEAMKQEAVVGLSKGVMAFRQLVVERIQPNDPAELTSLLTEAILGRTFPNWQTKLSMHATIRREIEHELVKYAEENPSVNLSPDDYAKFSREAIKYAEMYF
jgi:hypothetical protein